MSSFYRPLRLNLKNVPVILYPYKGIETLLGREKIGVLEKTPSKSTVAVFKCTELSSKCTESFCKCTELGTKCTVPPLPNV